MFDIRNLISTGHNSSGFVWTGEWGTGAAGEAPAGEPELQTIDILKLNSVFNYDTQIHVHGDHPEIQNGDTANSSSAYDAIYADGNTFKQAKTASVNNKQTAYYYDSNINRTVKMAFEPNDQYLLGGKSCGAYLFLSPLSIDSLTVDADNTSGKYTINTGESNAVSIDVVFQYRMTDYAGTSESSLGYVGGISTQPLTNLTYSKKIGLDILDSENNKFSFDLEVFAKYSA